jgi:peptidoglycan/xylan/chitin deacetylase (PgdA/CDA1 family)
MNKVINLHAVHDAAWFESVIRLLLKKHKMASAQDIYDYYYNGKKLKNACLITVDDGHKTSYDVIYPVLKKYNVPAIFFVSPQIAQHTDTSIFWFQAVKQIGDENLFQEINSGNIAIDEIQDKIARYVKNNNKVLQYGLNMTVEQIKQIDEEGLVTIGAHTLTHPFLARESNERSKHEIVTSVVLLEQLLGHPVQFFAYPNGIPDIDWGEREIKYLKDSNVKISFSTQPDNFSLKNNCFAIPRLGLTCGSVRFVKIKLVLGKYYPAIKSLVSQIKKIVRKQSFRHL